MPSKKNQDRVRDPIHGFIEIEHVFLKIIDTPAFQRLRGIRQLGCVNLVYPGANHTRFSHSVGANFTMRTAISNLLNPQKEINEEIKNQIDDAKFELKAAALLHDIGHGPLSHTFEEMCREVPRLSSFGNHAASSFEIIKSTSIADLLSDSELSLPGILNILEEKQDNLPNSQFYLHQLIDSQLDVDKADYLLRDAYYTGVKYGTFDLSWVLSTLSVATVSESVLSESDLSASEKKDLKDFNLLCVEEKGVFSVLQMILARLSMFNQVYLHKSVRAFESLYIIYWKHLYTRLDESNQDPINPSISDFMSNPSIDSLLNLSDYELFTQIRQDFKSKDKDVQLLATSLFGRRKSFTTVSFPLPDPHSNNEIDRKKMEETFKGKIEETLKDADISSLSTVQISGDVGYNSSFDDNHKRYLSEILVKTKDSQLIPLSKWFSTATLTNSKMSSLNVTFPSKFQDKIEQKIEQYFNPE